jgi:hypothetical protein
MEILFKLEIAREKMILKNLGSYIGCEKIFSRNM